MKKKPLRPVTFRLYPEGSFLYAVVNIWPNKRAMQDYKRCGRGYTAICTPMERMYQQSTGRWRKRGQFAEINFHRRAIGSEVVSHEIAHATFSWAARRRLPVETIHVRNVATTEAMWSHPPVDRIAPESYEEHFALALGRMVRQFTQKCYDLGLYSDVVESKT